MFSVPVPAASFFQATFLVARHRLAVDLVLRPSCAARGIEGLDRGFHGYVIHGEVHRVLKADEGSCCIRCNRLAQSRCIFQHIKISGPVKKDYKSNKPGEDEEEEGQNGVNAEKKKLHREKQNVTEEKKQAKDVCACIT